MKTFSKNAGRMVGSFALALVALVALAACESHYTTQEAYDACQKAVDDPSNGDDPERFAACVACYENCGDDCQLSPAEAPTTFTCPDDEGGGGAGGG